MTHQTSMRNIATVVFLTLVGSFLVGAQELKPVKLPPPQTEIGKPLMQALKLRQSTRSFDTKALPLQELSNLLWAANGINRAESGKRTVPSAKNWQEQDVYVVLPEGAFLYDAGSHSLNPVVAKDLRAATGGQGYVKDAPLNLVYVADHARMSNAGDQELKLYGATDAAFIAQNVYLYAASQGLATVVRGGIDRPALAKALMLRPEQAIILAQTVGYPK